MNNLGQEKLQEIYLQQKEAYKSSQKEISYDYEEFLLFKSNNFSFNLNRFYKKEINKINKSKSNFRKLFYTLRIGAASILSVVPLFVVGYNLGKYNLRKSYFKSKAKKHKKNMKIINMHLKNKRNKKTNKLDNLPSVEAHSRKNFENRVKVCQNINSSKENKQTQKR